MFLPCAKRVCMHRRVRSLQRHLNPSHLWADFLLNAMETPPGRQKDVSALDRRQVWRNPFTPARMCYKRGGGGSFFSGILKKQHNFGGLRKNARRDGEKEEEGEQPQRSVIICIPSRRRREARKGGSVRICVHISVCLWVLPHTRVWGAGCGGANGVLIAWQ